MSTDCRIVVQDLVRVLIDSCVEVLLLGPLSGIRIISDCVIVMHSRYHGVHLTFEILVALFISLVRS